MSDKGKQQYPTIIEITNEEIDIQETIKKITLPSTGAACFFSGLVRAITPREHNRITDYLEYEAYETMAEQKMYQITDEIRKQYPTIQGIAIIHRIGTLYPETPSVLIACTAPHRDTGVFEGTRYGIDRLKQIVPIWKKEVGPDGEEWIEGDYTPVRE